MSKVSLASPVGTADDRAGDRPEGSVVSQARPAALRNGRRPVPVLALSPDEAAVALGVSRDFFDEHVAPELKIVRRGRRLLIAVPELERWLTSAAALTVGKQRCR